MNENAMHTGSVSRTGWRYGLLGFALAFVALPLYVHLPHVYASRYGMSLTTLGGVLLLARVLDALIDPTVGRWGDRLYAHTPSRALAAAALAAVVLALGMGLLFFPPWSPSDNPLALLATLMTTYLAYSMLAITHQSWGARLASNDVQRAQVVAWREGWGLAGVICASLLPSWLGWEAWWMLFVLALWVGWYAWLRCPRPEVTLPSRAALSWHDDLHHPWRVRAFRRLMGIFVLSGMASAVAATLVIFFIQDLLQAPAHEPLFLGLYFLAAAMSMPMWMRSVRRWGLARSWLGGMGVSVLVFVWAMQLGAGNVLAFGWVCVLSGAALGADLAIPSAMLASVIAQRGDSGTHEGAYFGWWTLASKLNLALAAGLTLPLLAWLGYQPANATPQGLQALSLIYALVPCALKLMAGSLLYVSFVRESSSSTSHFSEAL